ncbi:DUF3958 family protein [Carnobacterium gallinarum]|uniref:DUF3958 family protein n=1 Tax=Carnobacterium gallinarum TaxID=2749 RepID=UPI00055844E7|nr:DUF3958 family protein [Carnobacterium gallinarum]
MDKWETLHQKECRLRVKEEINDSEIRQIQRLTEAYESHFHEAQHLLEDLDDLFYKHDRHSFYESVKEEFYQESRDVQNYLEESNNELTSEKWELQGKLDEVAYEKRQVILTEKEKLHEY